jgi:hypothetical protein
MEEAGHNNEALMGPNEAARQQRESERQTGWADEQLLQ